MSTARPLRIPRCPKPEAPGLYLYARPRCMKFLVQVLPRKGELWAVDSGAGTCPLNQVHEDFRWWGPFTLQR